MSPHLIYALMKKLEQLASANPLTPGRVSVDETVTFKVKGTVNKGADVEYVPTVSIPLLPTMALLMEKAGFQRENCIKLLSEAMIEAIELQKQGAEVIEEKLKNVKAAMTHVESVTNKLPTKIRTGRTTIDIELTEIGDENNVKS